MLFNKIKNRITNVQDKILKLIILAQTLMFASVASAQMQMNGPFTPTDGDISIKIISKIFGGLTGVTSGGSDPLLDLITTFNGCMLTIASIIVAYTIFLSIVGTAHEGEMLGKQFSAAWIPIRNTIGIALIFPINGYCAMQYIVMWLIVQGIGLADTIWTSAIQGDMITDGMVSSYGTPLAVNDLVKNTLNASICYVAMKKFTDANKDALNYEGSWEIAETTSFFGRRKHIDFQETTPGIISGTNTEPACGRVSLAFTDVAPSNKFEKFYGINKLKKPDYDLYGGLTTKMDFNNGAEVMINAHNVAARETITKMLAFADELVEAKVIGQVNGVNQVAILPKEGEFNQSKITEAVEDYGNKLTESVKATFASNESTQEFNRKLSDEGWIMGGAWFVRQAQIMSQVTGLLNEVPKSSYTKKVNGGTAYESTNHTIQILQEAVNSYEPHNNKSSISFINDKKRSELGIFNEADEMLVKMLSKFITGVDLTSLQETTVHPIMQLKMLGDKFITTAMWGIVGGTSAIAVSAGAIGATSNALNMTGASSAISTAVVVSPIMFTIFGAMLTLGFFLAYYIPMLPFLIWLGCLVGYFVMILEAVLAAPLWAVMHLHPKGEDAIGKAQQGYSLITGLLLRPALMVCGLVFALILSSVLGQFINSIFYEMFYLSLDGAGLNIFSLILCFVLYTTMFLEFVKKMFAVIHMIPDQLLRWANGGSGQLGEFSGALTQGSEGQFMRAGAFFGAVSQSGSNAGMGAVQRMHQAGLQKQQSNQDAAHQIGIGQDVLSNMTSQAISNNKNAGISNSGKNALTQQKVSSSIASGRQELLAMGASPSEQAKYTTEVMKGLESGQTLNQAKESATNDFLHHKFGSEGMDLINSASREGNGTNPSEVMNAASKIASIPESQRGEFYSHMNSMKNASSVEDALNNPSLNDAGLRGSVESYSNQDNNSSFVNGYAGNSNSPAQPSYESGSITKSGIQYGMNALVSAFKERNSHSGGMGSMGGSSAGMSSGRRESDA